MRSRIFAAIVFAAGLAASAAANVDYGFAKITSNSVTNVASQLNMNVSEGAGTAVFTFTNDVGLASSVTEIYFSSALSSYVDTTQANVGIANSAGVLFTAGANPPALPGGAPYGLGPNAGFIAYAADASPTANGIDASGESVAFTFGLLGGVGFDDLIAALNSFGVRVGLHVRAHAVDNNSDGYVHIPAPAAILLGLIGLSGATAFRRKLA